MVAGIKPKFPFDSMKFLCHDLSSASIWAIPECTCMVFGCQNDSSGSNDDHNFVVSCSLLHVRRKVFKL